MALFVNSIFYPQRTRDIILFSVGGAIFIVLVARQLVSHHYDVSFWTAFLFLILLVTTIGFIYSQESTTK